MYVCARVSVRVRADVCAHACVSARTSVGVWICVCVCIGVAWCPCVIMCVDGCTHIIVSFLLRINLYAGIQKS